MIWSLYVLMTGHCPQPFLFLCYLFLSFT